MVRTWRMSRPVCAVCRAISVVTTVLAPASSTKDAAICVTAKMRWRRLVLPVIRVLPIDKPWPLDVSADGHRRSHPEQAGINRQIERADREARGVAGQDSHQRLRAPYTDGGPSAAEQKAFCQEHAAQRACACAERRTGCQFAFTANGPRENQVGHIGARDDED